MIRKVVRKCKSIIRKHKENRLWIKDPSGTLYYKTISGGGTDR